VSLEAQSYNTESGINARNAAVMNVYLLPGANAMEVAGNIRATMEEISRNFPEGMTYDIPFDVGTRFAYNNLEPFVLSVFFQESFGINLKDYINEKIFKKLNIKEFEWDNYGKYCPAATGLYLKHSDFHKIGLLLLNNGRYDGKQIIPGNWIVEMTSMQLETPSTYKPERVFPKIGVGYYTFISRDNYIFRDGSNGQYIIVNKEKKLL
jgi:CubicO group peptidase (beta-lactamase class C family)